MTHTALLARATVVVILVWSCTSSASELSGAHPGITTQQQLLESFGEPSQRATRDGEVVLGYWDKAAPSGTRGVQFRVSQQSGRLQRIDVFPGNPLTRAQLDEQFGPACGDARPRKGDKALADKKPADRKKQAACYVVKVTPGNRFYFHYVTLGVAVFFDHQQVYSLAYVPPSRTKRPSRKEAPLDEPPELAAEPTSPLASSPETEPAPTPPSADEPASTPEPTPTPEPTLAGKTIPASGTVSGDPLLRRPTIESDEPPEKPGATAPVMNTPGADMALKRPTIESSDSGETVAISAPTVLDTPVGPSGGTPSAGGTPSSISSRDEVNQKNDFLTLGGLFYQRADLIGSLQDEQTRLQPTVPSLVRLYLDAKPFERLRGFMAGQLVYNPLDPALSVPVPTLDQLWFSFDLGHRVFFTVGRQPVKWGSSMIWNPTDFLQQPNPAPLEGFDVRTGVDMVKVNIPWESVGAHLSLIATADLNGPENDRLRYGGAMRADIPVSNFGELSFVASFLQHRRPRYGADLNLGLGPLDVNAEVALVRDSEVRLWQLNGTEFSQRDFGGPKLLASGGLGTQIRVADIYGVNLRVEGFYNSLGYDDRVYLTWLNSKGDYRGLFFGRYYAMGQIAIARRSSFNPVLTLTTVANVLDRSLLNRLEFMLLVTPSTRIFFYTEVPLGARGSEFLYQPDLTVADAPAVPLGLFRAGMYIRMRL